MTKIKKYLTYDIETNGYEKIVSISYILSDKHLNVLEEKTFYVKHKPIVIDYYKKISKETIINEGISINNVLLNFIKVILLNKPLIIGHNICGFDNAKILNSIKHANINENILEILINNKIVNKDENKYVFRDSKYYCNPNKSFDITEINNIIIDMIGSILKKYSFDTCIDTKDIIQKKDIRGKVCGCKLDYLYSWCFNKKMDDNIAHTSDYDTLITYECFIHLKNYIKNNFEKLDCNENSMNKFKYFL